MEKGGRQKRGIRKKRRIGNGKIVNGTGGAAKREGRGRRERKRVGNGRRERKRVEEGRRERGRVEEGRRVRKGKGKERREQK